MKTVIAYIVLALLYPIGCLPVRWLHAFSYIFVYWPLRIIGYRKAVIYTNLARCFPEKKYGELKIIAHQFYWFLARVFPEMVWLYVAGNKKISRRCKLPNLSIVKPYLEHSVIVVMGHFGNWEFLKMMAGPEVKELMHPYDNNVAVIYKAPERALSNIISYKMRSKKPMVLVESQQVSSFMFKHRKERWIYFFIADQAPLPGARFATEFLSQPTPMITGPETLARTFGLPVLYFAFHEKGPCRYQGVFTPICDNAKTVPENSVTEQFTRLLEKDIIATPYAWLWSHRRWKRGLESMRGA